LVLTQQNSLFLALLKATLHFFSKSIQQHAWKLHNPAQQPFGLNITISIQIKTAAALSTNQGIATFSHPPTQMRHCGGLMSALTKCSVHMRTAAMVGNPVELSSPLEGTALYVQCD
jgi:hypothetical protein